MPIVVDGGAAELAQSRHHLNEAPEATNPAHERARTDAAGSEDTGSDREIDKIQEKIISMVQSEIAGEADEMVRRLVKLVEERERMRRGNGDLPADRPTTIGELYNAMKTQIETLTKRIDIPQPPQPRTWASIASGTTSPSAGASWAPRKVVPARHAREVVIKTKGGTPPQLPTEVVAKVNAALRSSEALAARRLQSGDIVVSFKDSAEAHTRDNAWVKAAFGDQAAIAKRTYAVLLKGIPRGLIERRADKELRAEIEKTNEVKVARCRRKLPRSKEAAYGALLVEVEAVAIAQQLCNQGAVIEAQIFNCKPYSGELQVLQCFNCHAYGHLAKACTQRGRCGFCGRDTYKQGDDHCPARKTGSPACINCRGRHPAWDRRCPAALRERQRIKDAYAYRPRQFVVGGSDISWSMASDRSLAGAPTAVSSGPAATQGEAVDNEGFQEVAPKRKKTLGRPRDLDRPETGNIRIDRAFTRSQSVAALIRGDSSTVLAIPQPTQEY